MPLTIGTTTDAPLTDAMSAFATDGTGLEDPTNVHRSDRTADPDGTGARVEVKR